MINLTIISSGTSTSTSSTSPTSRSKRRPNSGVLLRAAAAANNVGRRGTLYLLLASPVLDNGDQQVESMASINAAMTPNNHDGGEIPRPSLASAGKSY